MLDRQEFWSGGPVIEPRDWRHIEKAYGSKLAATERNSLDWIILKAKQRRTGVAAPGAKEVKARLAIVRDSALKALEALDFRPGCDLLKTAPVARNRASGATAGAAAWRMLEDAIDADDTSRADRETFLRNFERAHLDDFLLVLWSASRLADRLSRQKVAEGRRRTPDRETIRQLIDFHHNRIGKNRGGLSYSDEAEQLTGPVPRLARELFDRYPAAFAATRFSAIEALIRNYRSSL